MTWTKEDREGQEFSYVMDIFESRAGTTSYNQGNTTLLILEGERELPNGKREEHHLWLSCGKALATADGTHFEFPGEPKRRLDPQCKVQKFIASAIKAGVPLEKRGDSSLDATMWKGLRLHITESRQSKKIGGEDTDWTQPIVTEYLGEIEGGGTATATNGSAATDYDPDELNAMAAEMKKKGADHLDFMQEAHNKFGIPMDHSALSESGVWAQV